MNPTEHYIQDACEVYAPALLQQFAQDAGLSITNDAEAKMKNFHDYAKKTGLVDADFNGGKYAAYKSNLDRHLPAFFAGLVAMFPGQSMDFENVEVLGRNMKNAADFKVTLSSGKTIPFSLKNYRGTVGNPQVCAGTFNSFVLNFLFAPKGVGSFIDPTTGERFLGANKPERDRVLAASGYGYLIPVIQGLDALNLGLKKYADEDRFEFLDEASEKEIEDASKALGNAGADLAIRVISGLDPARVKARLLKVSGLDGEEEFLFIEPGRFTDSLTCEPFRRLRRAAQDAAVEVRATRTLQGIAFDFVADERVLLHVYVPFTLNRNGSWISDENHRGGRYHAGEKKVLDYGQRRPKKSRQIATSINTYVNFAAAGIFVVALDEV